MKYKTIGLKEKKGNEKIHISGFNCFIISHVIASVCYPTYQICTDIHSSPSLLEPHQSHRHHLPGLFQQTPKVSLLPLSPSHSLFLTQQPDRHDYANYLFKTLQWLLTQINKQRLSSACLQDATGPSSQLHDSLSQIPHTNSILATLSPIFAKHSLTSIFFLTIISWGASPLWMSPSQRNLSWLPNINLRHYPLPHYTSLRTMYDLLTHKEIYLWQWGGGSGNCWFFLFHPRL